MREHLITLKLFEYVGESPISQGTSGSSEEAGSLKTDPTADTRPQEAKSILISTISDTEIAKIIQCNTAAEIWRHFKDAQGKKSENEKLEIMMELNTLKCAAVRDAADIVNKALTLKGKLTNLGIEVGGTLLR